MADTLKILVAEVFAAIMRGLAIVREFVIWAFSDTPAEDALPRRPLEPRRLSLAEQWTFLSDVVLGAAARAEEAARCQVSAAQQVDLAQYGLMSLVDELAAVMDMGDRVRRRATVHVLGVQTAPPLRQIGDAIAA